MNPLRVIRRRRRPLAGQILAMLGVVWLNMVLQPCLMAAETDMDMDTDMSMPCPHCPTSMTDSCDTVTSSSCTYVDEVDYDGRSPHSKLAKKVDDTSIAFAVLPVQDAHAASGCATGPPRGTDFQLPTPPLNVIYCVYLN